MAGISHILDRALRVSALLLMLALLACVVIGVVMRAINNRSRGLTRRRNISSSGPALSAG